MLQKLSWATMLSRIPRFLAGTQLSLSCSFGKSIRFSQECSLVHQYHLQQVLSLSVLLLWILLKKIRCTAAKVSPYGRIHFRVANACHLSFGSCANRKGRKPRAVVLRVWHSSQVHRRRLLSDLIHCQVLQRQNWLAFLSCVDVRFTTKADDILLRIGFGTVKNCLVG